MLVQTYKDRKGTPLHFAVWRRKGTSITEAMRLLLQAKADLEATSLGDDMGNTPLILACHRGHLECVRLLIEWGAM